MITGFIRMFSQQTHFKFQSKKMAKKKKEKTPKSRPIFARMIKIISPSQTYYVMPKIIRILKFSILIKKRSSQNVKIASHSTRGEEKRMATE